MYKGLISIAEVLRPFVNQKARTSHFGQSSASRSARWKQALKALSLLPSFSGARSGFVFILRYHQVIVRVRRPNPEDVVS